MNKNGADLERLAAFRKLQDRCQRTDGAPAIWLDALKSVSGALDRAERRAEVASRCEQYRQIRPR